MQTERTWQQQTGPGQWVSTRHQRRRSAWMLARQQEADIQCWDLMQAERR